MSKRFLAFFCLVLLLKSAAGQTAFPTDTTRRAEVEAAVALYRNSLLEESGLYNGREYIRYNASYIGHAYFVSDAWQSSSILYDGMTYYDVPALYDLVKDELVIRHFNGAANIQLVKEKVAQFIIGGHKFIRIHADSTGSLQIRPGFYNMLYAGVTTVLVKRAKEIEERMIAQQIETRFEQSEDYYLYKNGTYYSIKNAAALFDVLNDRKKEVQQHLRKNGWKFRKNPGATLVGAAAYYDSLKK